MTVTPLGLDILDGYIGEIFVDASFWIALANPHDGNHNATRRIWGYVLEKDLQPITTNWTLYEALTHLNSRTIARHDLALGLSVLVHSTSIVEDASAIEQETIATFRHYSDRRWSIVDCANFVCIGERGIMLALSYDDDFCRAQDAFHFTRLPICG